MVNQALNRKSTSSESALKYLPPRKKLQSMYPRRTLIGITGHRDLVKSDFNCMLHDNKIKCKGNLIPNIQNKLLALRQNSSDLMLVSCLAQGADMLAAYVASQLHIPLIVIVPLKTGYTDRFSQAEQNLYNELCQYAGAKVYHLPTGNRSADNLYKNAGFFLVKNCHQLLALWDGVDTGKDGGTSQVVQIALRGGKHNSQFIHHLLVPRQKNLFPVEQAPDLEKGEFTFAAEYNWRTLRSSTCKKKYNWTKWWRSNDSMLLQFVVPVVLLLFTMIGGYWGFKQHFTKNKSDKLNVSLNDWEYFYKALNLATLNSSVIDHHPDDVPNLLHAARLSGAIFLIWAFLLALFKIMGANWYRLRIKRWIVADWFNGRTKRDSQVSKRRGFNLILGLSEKSHHLITDLRNHNRRVVVIDESDISPYLESCKNEGALFFKADPASPAMLKKIHFQKASHIYILSSNDSYNSRITQQLDQLIYSGKFEISPKIYIHVQDFRERDFLDQTTKANINTFNIYENIARRVLQQYPVKRIYHQRYTKEQVIPRSVQIILFGFGIMGQELAMANLLTNHFEDGIALSIKVYFLPRDIGEVDSFKKKYPCFINGAAPFETDAYASIIQKDIFFRINDVLIEFEELPTSDTMLMHKNFSLYSYLIKEKVIAMYFCLDDGLQSASLLSLLLPAFSKKAEAEIVNLQLFCYYNFSDEDEMAYVEQKLNAKAPNLFVKCFGNFLNECLASMIQNEKLDNLAKYIGLWYHYLYDLGLSVQECITRWEQETIQIKKEADQLWTNLNESFKESNRYAADHIFLKLRIAGITCLKPFENVSSMLEKDIATLAAIEHKRWCAEKLIDGFLPLQDTFSGVRLIDEWKYHKKVYQSIKLHKDLVPYNDLPDGSNNIEANEKEKDYSQIRGIRYFIEMLYTN